MATRREYIAIHQNYYVNMCMCGIRMCVLFRTVCVILSEVVNKQMRDFHFELLKWHIRVNCQSGLVFTQRYIADIFPRPEAADFGLYVDVRVCHAAT